MIIDTHVHATEAPSAERPYDSAGMPVEVLLIDDLLREAAAAGVDQIIQVVPSTMGYDNRYGFEVSDKHPVTVFGVIARFDPLAPDPESRFRALLAHPKTVGVRFTLTAGPRLTWLKEGKLENAFAAADKLGFAVQLFAPYQMPETFAAVRKYPKIRWLIDHMALRWNQGQEHLDVFRDWPDLIKLANMPNVWIKCSYFPEAAAISGEKYPFPTAKQRFKELYESCDPSRLIWGSNYPPVERACSYKQSVDWVGECAFIKAADRPPIMGGNFAKYFGR